MGFIFALIFVFTATLSPQVLFGELGQYHILVVLALLTMIFSLFSAGDFGLFKLPQTYGAFGLIFMVGVSLLFSGW